MKKLPIKDKVFWKNFIQFIGIFIIVWLILGYSFNNPVDDEPETSGFLDAYIVLSFLAILRLASKEAREFSELGKNEKYDEIDGKDFVVKEKNN